MLSPLPVTSRNKAPAILIAAICARALAQAARASGYAPLVADLFADLDTRAIAEAIERVPGSLAGGFDEDGLIRTLERLCAGRAPQGLVLGSGFEGRPALMAALAARFPLIGNSPQVVARLKDPLAFADLCARLHIPHPAVSPLPLAGEGWLAKRAGAAGGGHVLPAAGPVAVDARTYFQEHARGQAVSALFLADGAQARVLGFTRQWTQPAPTRPFRYGGAVRPAPVASALADKLAGAVAAIAGETGLSGLNSADFLVDQNSFVLLEINPRPGASLDVFGEREGRLFAAHVAAASGAGIAHPLHFDDASAAAIVYAARDIACVPAFDWPDWAADRQPAGTQVLAGEPVCTVRASAPQARQAVDLVRQRVAALAAVFGSATLEEHVP